MEYFLRAAEGGGSSSQGNEVEVMLRDFVVPSSLGHEFLVVSPGQLVADVRAPEEEELEVVSTLVKKFFSSSEAAGSVMIADFEGEMPGHGGELVTAAIMPTGLVDVRTLKVCPSAAAKPDTLGLLLDLRSPVGVSLVEQFMGSQGIVKLLWGADADLKSLMYQDLPTSLKAEPQSVVDVQLAFSPPTRRLGMQRALEKVPSRFLDGLPPKEQIDFDQFHSCNRRSMALPLSRLSAKYAMDDLHRIAAILQSTQPPGGSFAKARQTTESILDAIKRDPQGIESLRTELDWFRRKTGVKKLVMAVEIKRHILAIRMKLVHAKEPSIVKCAEGEVDGVLRRNRVTIPDDLSLYD